MKTASATIATFAANFRNYALTPAQRHLAYRALVDTYAVAIAGRHEDAPRIARAYVADIAGQGRASVWASDESMRAEEAAWLNAITAHVLDYDDVMQPMRGHISAALVPPLAALAQQIGASGRDYAQAYIAGFEVLAKFSRVMAIEHYSKGWHSTSALGVLGGAIAGSVLLGLDESRTAHALGLAVAQAGGTRQNFGTMAKSFQAGQCAAAAVRACLLAQAGFTAATESIDGNYGYLALYANREDAGPVLAELGIAPLDIEAIGIDIKKYPCCYATGRGIDAALALRQAHGLTLDAVESAQVTTSARGLEAVIYPRPTNGLEAKFSIEYTTAAALLDGSIGLSSFDDASVMRPAIRDFLPRISKSEAAGNALPRWTELKLTLKSGDIVNKRVVIARGDSGDPLSDDELIAKVTDCFAYGRHESAARDFAARAFAMDGLRFDEVLPALQRSAA